MPTVIADSDSLTIDTAAAPWVVKPGVVIATAVENRDAVTISVEAAQLFNYGHLASTGGGVFGSHGVTVERGAANAFIFNGVGGTIVGTDAFYSRGDGTRLFNDGTILGQGGAGVQLEVSQNHEVHNSGHISGSLRAIRGDNVGATKIFNSGVLESDGDAVFLSVSSGKATIVNTGTITGAIAAIVSTGFGLGTVVDNSGKIFGDIRLSSTGDEKVMNQGVVRGDVLFDHHDDVYQGGKGFVSGVVSGGDGDDRLSGGSESDQFTGGEGDDRLSGRGDDDILSGGEGADKLKGGSGGDVFIYAEANESRPHDFLDKRDTIQDFNRSEGDRIDLAMVDARNGGGDDSFDFIGTRVFSRTKGELRLEVRGDGVLVQGDTDGDGRPDIEIKVNDVGSLGASDFFL